MSDEIKTDEGGDFPAPSWKDSFKLRDDLRQRDVYAFETNVNKLGGLREDGASIRAVTALKAAIEAGWLVAPVSEVLRDSKNRARHFIDGEDVDDMHAGKVLFYGARVVNAYTSAISIPPN